MENILWMFLGLGILYGTIKIADVLFNRFKNKH